MEIHSQNILSTVLIVHHDIIVQDIQGDVIMVLYENKVLTESEYRDIKSKVNKYIILILNEESLFCIMWLLQNNPEKEASRLLELLPLKGDNGINQFLKYLSTYYSWIANTIQNSINNAFNDNTFVTNLQNVLTAGEVPQLSSRHVSRAVHVSKNMCYYVILFIDGLHYSDWTLR